MIVSIIIPSCLTLVPMLKKLTMALMRKLSLALMWRKLTVCQVAPLMLVN